MTEQVLTIDIDERVHDQLRTARAADPTAVDAMSGAVVVLGYDEVERLSHDVRLAGVGLSFFDLMGVPDGALRTWYSQLMFTNEGDAHHRLRRLAARVFTPRSVERHRELARDLTTAAFEDIIAAGGGDLVDAFAQVPIRVICRLLGVPDSDVANFVGYADALSPVFGFMDPEQIERADAAVQRLTIDVERMIAARADQRGDDLISALLDAEADGERLTHDEVVVMVGNLIVGGHDTTASQISCSLLTLLRHPAALDELRSDPTLASAVANETIRFEPSIRIVPRTVIEPIEIGGVERAAGTLLFLSSCSTSRETDVWGDPDAFRPARFTEPGAPKLLSFGAGPHYCLGAALARMTLEEVVLGAAATGLGDRMVPAIDITVGADVEWRQVLGYSPAALPVVVTC
jgi:cytochrome P450